MRTLLLLLFPFILCTCGRAPLTSPPEGREVLQPVWEETDYERNKYFSYYFPSEIPNQRGSKPAFWSFLGNLDSAEVAFQAGGGHPTIAVPADAGVLPAREAILELADKTEVTLINEAHHLPYHRTFTTSMLRGFYDLGYRHLGLEAVSISLPIADSLANAPDPQIMVGYYARETELGQLMREAKSIGFNLFGYDNIGKGAQPIREIGSMRTVMNYRAQHPDGKLLIHCGYAHAREGKYSYFKGGPLAQRLADTLGIDPLTISQTSFEPGGVSTISVVAPPYRPADDTASRFDLYVAHPTPGLTAGRPDYKFGLGRVATDVSITAPPTAGEELLLFALPTTGDMQLAIPYDVVPVTTASVATYTAPPGPVKLLLYDGRKAWAYTHQPSK